MGTKEFTELCDRLERVENLLQRLLGPLAVEEGRQLATADRAALKAHNREVLRRARARAK